jgi:hypothetical protein
MGRCGGSGLVTVWSGQERTGGVRSDVAGEAGYATVMLDMER